MVIYLDHSLISYFKDNKIEDKERNFFENLAFSYQHGRCLLCGDRATLNYLSSNLDSPFDKVFREIHSRMSELASLINYVEKVLCIINNHTEKLPTFLKEKTVNIPFKDAMQLNLYDCCNLIAENIYDCKFYNLIGKRYMEKNNLNKVLGMNFDFRNGGGSTIVDILSHHFDKGNVYLCFVDSDLKFSPDKISFTLEDFGATYQKVLSWKENTTDKVHLSALYIDKIYPHELENLIPLNCYKEMGVLYSKGEKFLNELKQIDNGTPILFYDLKNGFDLNKCNKHIKKYWKDILAELKHTPAQHVLPKVLKNFTLSSATSYLAENNVYLTLILDEYLLPYWEEIGRTVFTWGCASKNYT